MKDLLCFSLVLFVALVRSAVPDRGTRDLTSLAVDIETEKIKRLQLEVQVETLASQIITLQSRKHADDKQAVSFTAGVSQSIDTFSNNQIIVYDDVISNVGNGYNSQTGRFTAPVDGLYNFYFKTSVKGYHLLNMDLIVDDSAPVVSAYSAGQSATSGTGSASISMLLKKGSCVWVRARSPYASHLFGNSWNTFSGFLEHETKF